MSFSDHFDSLPLLHYFQCCWRYSDLLWFPMYEFSSLFKKKIVTLLNKNGKCGFQTESWLKCGRNPHVSQCDLMVTEFLEPEGTRNDLTKITQLLKKPRSITEASVFLPHYEQWPNMFACTSPTLPLSTFIQSRHTNWRLCPHGVLLQSASMTSEQPRFGAWSLHGQALSWAQTMLSCLLFAGLAGRGWRQTPSTQRTGPSAERHVRCAEPPSHQQLCTGSGEVQYLYGACFLLTLYFLVNSGIGDEHKVLVRSQASGMIGLWYFPWCRCLSPRGWCLSPWGDWRWS